MISRLLAQSLSLGIIQGVPVARGLPSISHLMFADDLFLFCRANCRQAWELKDLMTRYCSWSGQVVNMSKSSIAFSGNTHPKLKQAVLNELQLKEMKIGSLYLGLPLLLPRSGKKAFADLKEKISGRLRGWKARALSQAGRTVLLKSVAAAMPLYPVAYLGYK